MVIFIAGLIGVGKTTLATALAHRLELGYCDLELIKKEIYPTDPDYERNLAEHIPFSDATRLRVYTRAIEQFGNLCHTHAHIVVDEVLHKERLRQELFDGATRVCGGYIVVLVVTDETHVTARLNAVERKGHILKDPLGMYRSLKAAFEAFPVVDIAFENNGPLEESVALLTKLVGDRLAIDQKPATAGAGS